MGPVLLSSRHMESSVDDFLSRVPAAQREALQGIRSTIARVVPEIEETISYGIPTFKYRGKGLVGFGPKTDGCTFYVMDGTILDRFPKAGRYRTGKGSLGFDADDPLPNELVEEIVRARMAEIDV